MTIGEAVTTGLVNNQTLGYFLARTHMWAERIGVDPTKMRFRQHLKTEMAHYAADCWDLEIKLSYGWVECVGHADRACYDLTQHAEKSGVPMVASMRLPEPVIVDRLIIEPNKKAIGPRFKGDQKLVIAALESADEDESLRIKAAMDAEGKTMVAGFEITADLVDFKAEKKTVVEMKYTPSVIEPSFGIGRIIHSVLEHAFSQREGDENRCVMRFRPCVAPIKVGVYRLINNPEFDIYVSEIQSALHSVGIIVRVDSTSGTVGRRYARADELGIPFGVTIDFQTLLDETVTVRERDSMTQIRLKIADLVEVLRSLVLESLSWEKAYSRFPIVTAGDTEDDEAKPGLNAGSAATKSGDTLYVERTLRGSFSRPSINLSG